MVKLFFSLQKINDKVYNFCLSIGEKCMKTIETQDINQLGVNLEAFDFYTNVFLSGSVSSGCCSLGLVR